MQGCHPRQQLDTLPRPPALTGTDVPVAQTDTTGTTRDAGMVIPVSTAPDDQTRPKVTSGEVPETRRLKSCCQPLHRGGNAEPLCELPT